MNDDDVIDFSLGTHSPSDRLWVHEFDEQSAQRFSDKVLSVAEKDAREPIAIYIDSYGGAIDGLATMISVMDAVQNPFITIATGKAMSAGAMLLSHGDIRCVGVHARVMIHEASGGAGGNVNDIKVATEELHRMNEYFMSILARNCGKTLKQLQKIWAGGRDTYMDAGTAVKFGIADHIGIPTIVKADRFDLKFNPNPAMFNGPKPKQK